MTVSCSSEQSPHNAARSLNGTLPSVQTTVFQNSRKVRHIKCLGSLATCLITFPRSAFCASKGRRRVLSLPSKNVSTKCTNMCRVGSIDGSIQAHGFWSLLLDTYCCERATERGTANLFSDGIEKSKLRYNSNANERFRATMEVQSARAQFCLTLIPLDRCVYMARIRC